MPTTTLEIEITRFARFTEHEARTVSRPQALEALSCCLRTGTPLPSLTWC
jgi:hypothetical protein